MKSLQLYFGTFAIEMEIYCKFIADWIKEFLGGTPEVALPNDWFSSNEILSYAEIRRSSKFENVDKTSWKDLNFDRYVSLIAGNGSILAKQIICKRIIYGQSAEDIKEYINWHLEAGMYATSLIGPRCKPLQKISHDLVPAIFLEHLPKIPVTTRMVVFYVGLLILSATAAFLGTPSLGALGAFAAFLFYATVTVRTFADYCNWTRLQDSLTRLLIVAEDLMRPDIAGYLRTKEEVGEWRTEIASIRRRISPPVSSGIFIVGDYIQMFTLRNHWQAHKKLSIVRENMSFFEAVFKFVANSEADFVLYEHIRQNSTYISWRKQSLFKEFRFDDLLNPNELGGEPMSVNCAGTGAFITGANGAGKSTLLRGLAMNFAIGNSLGFCYAKYACIPNAPVRTSMVGSDEPIAGLSLYMSEMLRTSEILSDVQARVCVCFFDEIFKGTNYVESLACAAAILRYLEVNAIAIFSSHHIELGEYISRKFDRFRLIKEGGRVLEAGIISKTNGIAMMAEFNIPKSIIFDAETISTHMTTKLARTNSGVSLP
ncbi:hypothetical protein ACG0Z6_14340 [Roseateles sp. BYS180W]|uniref:DNA mismatch repair proteins mutS family domain-containing protein n=1 Tax=Roseateles rivi TaxID=3299028 RepID=A0ABW7FYJ9_9BURK